MTEIQTPGQLNELARFSARIVQSRLAIGPGGNTSIRDADTMWISPSGSALDEIDLDSWVPIDIENGSQLSGGHRPSSELSMHLALYRRRSDVNAVVHTHPSATIAVVSAGYDEIPYMFPDQVAVVGPLGCIDYVVPCTPQLAQAVDEALGKTALAGLLMRSHGLITVGHTMSEAYYRTEIVEEAARTFWMAQTLGGARTLSAIEAEEILALEAEQYRQRLLRTSLAAPQ